MAQTNDYIEISGTVRAVLFQNEENGYTVLKLETQDGEQLTAVGCLPYAGLGERITLVGEFTRHPSHGEQFRAEWAERTLPSGADEIYEYLSSRAIKGIGPATASLIVSEFGDKTLQVMEQEPERLAAIRGIGRRKAQEISEIFRKQVGIRRLMELLGNYGIKPVIAIRLYHDYGTRARELLEENPYIIANERIGATFSEADHLAISLGFESDCAERVEAAALYELWHNAGNGHSFIPVEKLIAITAQLIGVEAEAVEEAIQVLADSGELVRVSIADREACYLASLYEAEVYTAERIKAMAKERPKVLERLSELITQVEKEQAVGYAGLQLQALKHAAQSRLMVLTGGPGTGKTTTVRGLVSLYEKLGLKTLLTAPTGRAAKRMSELTGREAATVHRLLEAAYSPETGDMLFRRDEDEPLDCEAVILDECSMVDIYLMAALLRALPEDCRLIMVGDSDQLPSVGPGNVFLDLIRSGFVETVRLTEIFRQGAESRIVAGAHMINRGDCPDLRGNTADSDFFFLRRENPDQAVETIKDLCGRRLPGKMGIPVADIQVLTPTRRGRTGTLNLNIVLQEALNPALEIKKEKKFGEIVFREGDRVMQTRNNYDIMWAKPDSVVFAAEKGGMPLASVTMGEKPERGLGIYNGDIGFIVEINAEAEQLSILFDDRLASYGFELLPELEHAYAMTVHKSQGSEFRAVVLSAVGGPPQLLSRSVLYTAVTRARELLILVGNEGTVIQMINNHKQTRRYSGLRARLTD